MARIRRLMIRLMRMTTSSANTKPGAAAEAEAEAVETRGGRLAMGVAIAPLPKQGLARATAKRMMQSTRTRTPPTRHALAPPDMAPLPSEGPPHLSTPLLLFVPLSPLMLSTAALTMAVFSRQTKIMSPHTAAHHSRRRRSSALLGGAPSAQMILAS